MIKKKPAAKPKLQSGRAVTKSASAATAGKAPKSAAKPSKEQQVSNAYAQLPGVKNQPTGPAESWRQITAARITAFEHTVPAYLLDENFFFLDWNPAFDELFAQSLKLRRRTSHAGDFVAELVNPVEILKRATQVFDKDPKPLVDLEPLQLKSKKYGLINFRKIAVQISDSDAKMTAWAVYLNIESCENAALLWSDLQRRLESELNWSRYAISYDKLLLNFSANVQLLETIVAKVAGCQRCLDLGAGTGNVTLQLLQSDDSRFVCAVEPNHAMAQQLISKVEHLESSTNTNYFSRLHVMKESIQRLDEYPKIVRPGSYDAALLVNVLYAIDDPQKCLEKVAALLKPRGKLVLSTSHRETNVDHLFAVMEGSLREKGLFQSLKSNFVDARERHAAMISRIHRDTKAEIRGFVERAGFDIVEWSDGEYANAVVVVHAEKR